ncbi:MAG: hypothetical protein ABSG67_18055 [Thermoguttaceae bacterium]|jgi:hypothetical protein
MENPIWSRLLSEDILPLLIPIVGIVSITIAVIVKKAFAHRERMAMIERGIHPDYPPENEEDIQNPPSKI